MTVLYFARFREQIGASEEKLSLPASVTTVGQLREWLAQQSEAHAAALGPDAMVKIAVNQSYAGPEAPVADGDEVAIFPPVTGG